MNERENSWVKTWVETINGVDVVFEETKPEHDKLNPTKANILCHIGLAGNKADEFQIFKIRKPKSPRKEWREKALDSLRLRCRKFFEKER